GPASMIAGGTVGRESYTCSYVGTSWMARARASEWCARLGGGRGVLAARAVPGRLPGLSCVASAPGGTGLDHRAPPAGRARCDAWRLARRAGRSRSAAPAGLVG